MKRPQTPATSAARSSLNRPITKVFCTILAASAATAACHAQLTANSDFENGTTSGWSTAGDVQVKDVNYGLAPAQGTFHAVIINDIPNNVGSNPSTTTSALESFLGLAAGSLTAASTATAWEGSAIEQQITVQAGQTLTFSWDFATQVSALSSANDYGFFSVAPVGQPNLGSVHSLDTVQTLSPQSFAALSPASSVFPTGHSGYQTGQFTFSSSGTYLIGFGVMDVGNSSASNPNNFIGNSGLFVDNLNLTAVPEPKAWSLVAGLGLASLAVMRRYRKLSFFSNGN